jgi:tRNA(Met) cytidine acetyltransferase
LLIADRGRGKSAAMGIAAARLLRERDVSLLVTAPNRAACQALFERVEEVVGPRETGGKASGAGPGGADSLRFVAPDELLRRSPAADLLLVDEAAAIPLPMLTQMLKRHARIVFASTVHGYEGSGRGFGLRFQGLLDEHCPGWRMLRLNEPIRYAADDPVEALGFRALLLDAEPVAIGDDVPGALEQMTIEVLDRDRLVADESRLRQLFGLLVGAHYRTRPADLAQLLDADGLRVWGVSHEGRMLAAALVADEGGLYPGLSEAVARGERRPPGHLLAQTLAAHAGFAEAACCRFARVRRIAVHPDLQRRGIGGRLLAAIVEEAADRGLDFVGASFGATPDLLRFWRARGFATVRVGARRDAASGAHSAMVLRSLRPASEALWETLRQRFHRQLADWLIEPLGDLEPDLVSALLGERPVGPLSPEVEFDELDRRDLSAFAEGRRDFAGAQPALRRLCLGWLAQVAVEMRPVEVEALVLRVLQRRAEVEVVAEQQLAGRAELVKRLRAACRHLLELSAGDG